MLIWLPGHQLNLVLHAKGQGHKLGQGYLKVKVFLGLTMCLTFCWQAGGGPLTERHSCSMIFSKIIKFHDISMTLKYRVISQGFPGTVEPCM